MEVYGSYAEQQAFVTQLERIYRDFPDAVIVGSVGRAAIYASNGYGKMLPPLDLHDENKRNGYRDIDLVFVSTDAADTHGYGKTRPDIQHPLDIGLGEFIKQDGIRGGVVLEEPAGGSSTRVRVPKKVVEPVTRTLAGAPVRTFAIGAQLHVERLVYEGLYGKNPKVVHSTAILQALAFNVRAAAPHEFLPNDEYEPFRDFRRQQEQLKRQRLLN